MRLKCLINKQPTEAGFTLLEVIIAMAIMAIAFAAILAVEGGSINASVRAKQMNIVAMLARNQMVDTEYKIEGKTFDEVQKEEEGKFDEPYQDYRWKRVIKEIQFPKISTGSEKSQSDSGQSEMAGMITKLMTSFLSKAIREVSVTIFWKYGKTEQSYALSTYWVDLNYEFKFSE